MFSDDEWARLSQTVSDLLEVTRTQAKALHEATVINRELLENALEARRRNGLVRRFGRLPETERARDAKPIRKSRSGPNDARLRTWQGCCDYYQGLEQTVRRELDLSPDDRLPKEAFETWGGPPPRTVGYHMRGYGLSPEQWPPRTWNRDDDRVWHPPRHT